ncbi:hypothetical protein INT45_007404 [Circinella minor]|uniref:Uncharacterized protein n=1 Tax=Circinella minor TaxID=1195481 RepID=A0A8H7R795_9FUNG|nr:hypothetical protein INT45_007404 [Circinella minor]
MSNEHSTTISEEENFYSGYQELSTFALETQNPTLEGFALKYKYEFYLLQENDLAKNMLIAPVANKATRDIIDSEKDDVESVSSSEEARTESDVSFESVELSPSSKY